MLIGIVVAVAVSSFTAFAGQCEDVRGQVVRLHILANSNSDEDQALKLAVRDAVLRDTAHIFTLSAGKAQIEALALDSMDEIEDIARREIQRLGYDYPVKAQIVNMFFDTRTYGDATLPAGCYDAVRLTIGTGQGNNWWCVMFPPMCIPAATGDEGRDLERQIEALGRRPEYEPRFAVVELVENIRQRFKKETPIEGDICG